MTTWLEGTPSEYVQARGERRWVTGGDKPVVGLDIDGTLGDYHSHFLWFAEQWLGVHMPSASEINPGMPLHKFMGVEHHIYRECKLAYRQGGLKRFMPCYDYAAELTANVRTAGASLWICTTRPYLRLDNIDPDTREWLRRNEIEYDAVIFEGVDGKSKYADLVEQVGVHRISSVTDDLPEQTADAVAQGISTVYLRDQPYNRVQAVTGKRVKSLRELWGQISEDLEVWREFND